MHKVLTLSNLAGVSYHSLVGSQKQKKWHGRLLCWCDHVKTSTVELLTILTDLWLEHLLYWLCYRNVLLSTYRYGITPPQALWSMSIYLELQNRTPIFSSPVCSPCPCHAFMYSINVQFRKTSTYSVFDRPNVRSCASCWNQLVRPKVLILRGTIVNRTKYCQ